MQKITDNIYVESEKSVCNSSFVATRQGIVVVDTPLVPAGAREWAAEIARHGEIRYVINCEPHTDHFAGNCWFGGKVVAHEGTRRLVQQAKADDIKSMLQWMSPDSLPLDPAFRICPPDITFTDKMTIYLGEHTFELVHLPGHTPYNIAVYVPEEKIVFTSDNVNLGMPVFRDSLPDTWLESLDRYQELDVEIVVPGHGAVTDKSAFGKMKGIIQGWLDVVSDAIKQGLTLEETLRKVPQHEMFAAAPKEGTGAGFLNMNIEVVYRFLKK